MQWMVEYFEQPNGRQPAEVFEDSLDERLAGKLARIAAEIEHKGPHVGGGFVEPCRDYDGLWEIRVSHGKWLAREFFGFDRRRAVLLDGVLKQEGKPTPARAFKSAARYWREYQETKRVSPEVNE